MTERTKRIVGYTLWGVLLAGLIAAAVLAGSANARAPGNTSAGFRQPTSARWPNWP